MESTVETLSPTRVRLAIEVPFAELEPSLKKAYRDIGAQVNIPGFRKGKVPNAIIDQRVGREVVLDEAKNEVIRTQTEQAIRDHRVRRLGPAEVEVTDFADGQPLKFTAELDVRPEITLPKLDELKVSVDAIAITDDEVDTQLDGLRQRFATLKTVERAAQRGDFVQVDLAATVDGEEVPGGSATNLSHEIGSGQLLPGLDEAIEGLTAGAATTFETELVAGDFKGRGAEVAVTLRSVREREMPNLDDEFAQLASEFDTLDELRADLGTRLTRVKKVEQLYAARDQTLQALVAAADVPAPEGVVREELSTRKEAMVDQLERMGVSMEDFLASEGKTEAEVDADLTESASQSIRIQLLLDALAEAEQIQVSDDEFGHEVVHRAQRAGVAPQQYYDQLMRSGLALAVFGDVRRNKALAHVLERVSITDSNGERVSVEELRRAGGDDTGADHDHDLEALEPADLEDDHDDGDDEGDQDDEGGERH